MKGRICVEVPKYPVRKSLAILLFINLIPGALWSQSCSVGTNATVNFSTFCPAPTGGAYTINLNNGSTITIDADVTITGLLTVGYQGQDGLLIIADGVTLKVANARINNTGNDKELEINGTFDVTNELDFNSKLINIDGDGTLKAGTIVEAENVACTTEDGATPDCPTIISPSCAPAGSGLCNQFTTPIELVKFTVQTASSEVLLEWATASEQNFNYFSIERSQDGKEFREIERIPGHGTSFSLLEYSFQDKAPLIGRSYYRLRSVDFDGYTETFAIKTVDYFGKKSVRIFPNPTKDSNINLELSYTPTSPVKITVTDLAGLIKGEYMAEAQSASFNATLDPGTYLVKISSDDLNKVIRVVVH